MEATLIRTGGIPTQWPGGGLVPLPLTAETVSVLLGGLAALAFDWFPGLAGWFHGLAINRKKQIITLSLLGIVGAVTFGGCKGLFDTGFACQPGSLPEIIRMLLVAAASNQATHLLTKPSTGQG